MISEWWKAPHNQATGGYWDQGGCCDNDVHEHFKCLEEVALASAYLIERRDGSLAAWNCRAERHYGVLHIHPYENVVRAVHVNLPAPRQVMVYFSSRQTVNTQAAGLQWISRPY